MEYLLILLGIFFLLNILVSFYIGRHQDLEPIQKVIQIIVVWLLPFIGGIGLWLFNRSQDIVTPSSKEFGSGSANGVSSVDASLGSD
ncbi:hypothetical protein L2729_02735 [Shewanella gelidimarina]|uniref:hypothetical protein n=1 Tax=Shewanella gelidimarina TaxID=56813 RepID=UPI00200D8C42|nr:hypothetical protein [Shewanella gelidimarina]MCL1056907.1 hypothetical protein [Shewanella gelidimarina]